MKAYIGQVICNDEGKMMGKIVRIHRDDSGTILFYVPVFTKESFGNVKYFRSESGDILE